MADKIYVRRFGTSANDTMQGDSNADLMYGYAGNDTLYGNGGDDRMLGGDGNDTLYGGTGNDDLFGDNGADSLYGGDGSDTLYGGQGADRMDGGNGVDKVDYQASTAGVTINLTTGIGIGGHAQGDTFVSIEQVEASNFNDVITGNSDNNWVDANDGDDVIDGGAGDDHLGGGIGNDTFIGGQGADRMYGQLGSDTVDYSGAPETASPFYGNVGVVVDLDYGAGDAGYATGDTYSDIENVRGSKFNDIIIGNAEANVIEGNAGNDYITGRGGADTLDGGEGIDLLSYRNSSQAVNVNLGTNSANGGDATGNIIKNFENLDGSWYAGDDLTGSSGDNIINGWMGNDRIDGGGGNDTIIGWTGADTMTGGQGADTFVFDMAEEYTSTVPRDDIMDFKVGVDHIEFRGTGVDSMSDLTITRAWGHTLVMYENDHGQTQQIALWGVEATQLTQDSFVFT